MGIKGTSEVVAKKANDRRGATHTSPTPCGVRGFVREAWN